METRKYRIAAGIYLICIGLVYGTVSGPVELLPVIADALENNLEKIRTWRGSAEYTYSIEINMEDDQLLHEKGKESIDFLLDLEHEYYKNAGVFTAHEQWINELPKVKRASWREEAVVVGKTLYWLLPFSEDPNAAQAPRTLLIKRHESNYRGVKGEFFNPHAVIKGMVDDLPSQFRGRYERFSKNLADPLLREIHVSRENDRITVYLAWADTNEGIFGLTEETHIFDASKAFALIESRMKNALQEEIWQVSYTVFKGISLPIKISYYSEDRATGYSKTESEVTIRTEMLNEVLEENERSITLCKMGLRKGDYIVDHTKGGLRYPWDPDTSDLK